MLMGLVGDRLYVELQRTARRPSAWSEPALVELAYARGSRSSPQRALFAKRETTRRMTR